MAQVFRANPSTRYEDISGAIAFGPGGSFDCLGHYAKVLNCIIVGTNLRLACYATGYADSSFSIPACTRYRGKHIKGYFTSDGELGIRFHPMDSAKAFLPMIGE